MRLNFRLKGYVSHQYLSTIRYRNGYTTTRLLGIFTQRNFVADFMWLKLSFIQTKNCFELPFGGLRGNVCTPSIARLVGKPVVDYLFIIIDLFQYKRKSVKVGFFEGVGHFEHKFQMEGGVIHQPLLVSENEWLPFRVVPKYLQCIVRFCHKACDRWTDGQTETQNYDS